MLLARLASTGVLQRAPLSPPRFADVAKIDNALLRSNLAEVSTHLALHCAIAALGCESDGDRPVALDSVPMPAPTRDNRSDIGPRLREEEVFISQFPRSCCGGYRWQKSPEAHQPV